MKKADGEKRNGGRSMDKTDDGCSKAWSIQPMDKKAIESHRKYCIELFSKLDDELDAASTEEAAVKDKLKGSVTEGISR